MFFIILLITLALSSWFFTRAKAIALAGKNKRTASRPSQYALWTTFCCTIPVLFLVIIISVFGNNLVKSEITEQLKASYDYSEAELKVNSQAIFNMAKSIEKNDINDNTAKLLKDGHYKIAQSAAKQLKYNHYSKLAITILTFITIFIFTLGKIKKSFKVRNKNEKIINIFLFLGSTFAIFVTLATFISLIYESFRFFAQVNIIDFLFGLKWNVQSSSSFGAIPLFVGTIMIAINAMIVAIPIGLMSAIFMSEYVSSRTRAILKPCIEILAGIPTVVYGFFAVVTFGPMVKNTFNLQSSEIILVAGTVMGIMIIPYVSSLADDIISAVPKSLRDGALGLGSTKSETICKVVFPAALPGIIGGILLAISRAIGETMIVVMALSRSPANLVGEDWHKAFSFTESTTTVTVTIVDLLTGDAEFGSAKVQAAFALALILFIATLCLNVLALYIVRKYREQYD